MEYVASADNDSDNELLADAYRASALRSVDFAAAIQAFADMNAGDTGRPLTNVAIGSCRKDGW